MSDVWVTISLFDTAIQLISSSFDSALIGCHWAIVERLWPKVYSSFWGGQFTMLNQQWGQQERVFWLVSIQNIQNSELFLFTYWVFSSFPGQTTQAENKAKQNLTVPVAAFIRHIPTLHNIWHVSGDSPQREWIRIWLVIFLSLAPNMCAHWASAAVFAMYLKKVTWGNVKRYEAFDHLAFCCCSLRFVCFVRTTAIWNSEYITQ